VSLRGVSVDVGLERLLGGGGGEEREGERERASMTSAFVAVDSFGMEGGRERASWSWTV